ncbi:hypothetical protein ASPSYDRAFT_62080 [Aspergillus sydowii CBS 593.65]|uniref:FAD/NAD(P)-binding domain-containing protein n=1 Tax=Aspergillus sydowii CBS 593.65 TaxID=1036612 RepID=A0A1L9T1Y0_9EURO|nr:uncharacterized protein ASPSYDRAFT_62080 [Aspergillus sydowii CBS 593.65]OJJ53464.1 hypothetical protein ASPSYDRAFT_62080 [Aspergillus sydowii CBS 593.65]
MGSAGESIVDALVVGAGMGGVYSTYRLSQAGLQVQCIEAGGDVGGTWYWNTYPGAMSDTESYLYRYSWDKEDLQSYPWDRYYLYQPEILEYIRHVVKRHDLRKYMRFNTEMQTAAWDGDRSVWVVTCSGGLVVHCRYLVNCLGILAKPNYPNIPGVHSFAGPTLHTARWDHSVKLEDKTVGIIGNGSTGIQVMTAIAADVGQLVSFQRHPQYSVPSGQGPLPAGYREDVNKNYDKIWEDARASATAFGIHESTRKTMEATPEERQQAFQEMWDQSNPFRFMFSAFGDLITDRDANEEACKFIRSGVKTLGPIFNRDNVDIVDLRETPIDEIVPEGIKVRERDGTSTLHPLDVLILATGFDAVEGGYLRLKITGREGKSLQEHWENGPTAYGGVACSGFPNMFLVSGPQAAFANFPPLLEREVEFIMNCILHSENTKQDHIMEVLPGAEEQWNEMCQQVSAGSLFKDGIGWFFGINIEGRKPVTKFYFGGFNRYREWTDKVVEAGFPGFAGTK